MRNTLLLPLLSLLLVSFLGACQAKKTETQPEVLVPAVIEIPYPPLGNQAISDLYSKADKVDMIFYNLPISVNQEDPASVKNTVLYVSPASPQVTANCQALGRLSWMSDGSIIKEADIFCADGCAYLLFIEGNQPVAANAMQQAGVDFFKNIISQVQQKTK